MHPLPQLIHSLSRNSKPVQLSSLLGKKNLKPFLNLKTNLSIFTSLLETPDPGGKLRLSYLLFFEKIKDLGASISLTGAAFTTPL
jgi:hypothetical protein